MGHFSAAFTLDRYGHVTEEMRKASSKRMQAFIENLEGKTNCVIIVVRLGTAITHCPNIVKCSMHFQRRNICVKNALDC